MDLTAAQADTLAALTRLFCHDGVDPSVYAAHDYAEPGFVRVHIVPWQFMVAPDGRVPMIEDHDGGFHTAA